MNPASLPAINPAYELEALRNELARRKAEERNQFLEREAATLEERLEQLRMTFAGEGGLIAFVRYFWDVLEPGKAFVEGWPLEAICQHLEAVTDGKIKRLLVNVPPGFMKSLLVDTFWPAWEWTACALSHLRYLTFSYSPEITQRDNVKFLALLQHPRMIEMYGDAIQLVEKSRYKVGNTAFGHKIASSVSGVSTGERADRVVCFPYGEIVQTEDGPEAIGALVDRRYAGRVWSYNRATDSFDLKPIERWIANRGKRLVRVRLAEGSLVCTFDHRIMLASGEWTEAGSLCSRDNILAAPGGMLVAGSVAPVVVHVLGVEPIHDVPDVTYCLTVADNHTLVCGTGCNIVCSNCDDPHNVKDAESQLVRESTVRWFQESMQNRLNDLGESAIVVIMQRVHEVDVSGVIIEHYPSYVHLLITMDYEERRHCTTYVQGEEFWTDPRSIEGELAFPERFPEETLDPFRLLRTLWSAQYQQSPSPRGGGIIKRADWRCWEVEDARRMGLPIRKRPDPERPGEMTEVCPFPPMKFVVASLDGAYTEKQENDPCALTVWGVWQNMEGLNRIMLCDAWATRFELHALVLETIKTCKRWKPDVLLIESKATGHSVEQEIRRLAADETWVTRLWDPGRGDKTSRAYAVQPMFETGLVWAPDRTYSDMVIDECARFPKGAHDDLVDTTTQALQFLRSIGMAELPAETVSALERELRASRKHKPLYAI